VRFEQDEAQFVENIVKNGSVSETDMKTISDVIAERENFKSQGY